MSASEFLRNEHQDILRLEKVITKSYKALYAGVDIPFSDIDKINFLIAEFLDSVHFTREEGSYFPCVASYDHLNKMISGGGMGMMGGAAPGTTSIKLDMHEYKQLGLSVGDKVNLDISKSETLGV